VDPKDRSNSFAEQNVGLRQFRVTLDQRRPEVGGHRTTFSRLFVDKHISETATRGGLFGPQIAQVEAHEHAGIADPFRLNLDLERVTGETLAEKINVGIDGKSQKILARDV